MESESLSGWAAADQTCSFQSGSSDLPIYATAGVVNSPANPNFLSTEEETSLTFRWRKT